MYVDILAGRVRGTGKHTLSLVGNVLELDENKIHQQPQEASICQETSVRVRDPGA